MIETAVILAAGLGSRLRSVVGNKPKGLLSWEGRPLLEHSISRLAQAGVNKLFLVVGFQAEQYEQALSQPLLPVTFILNKDYSTTGSMHSLSLCQGHVTEDFFLLESDLLYEFQALDTLRQSPEKDLVLLSGETGAGDEVHVYGRDNRLQAVSKQRLNLPWLGELVGISKISRPLLDVLCRHYASRTADPQYDYELCLADVSSTHPIATVTIQDLAWIEIDSPEHLEHALRLVGPRIRQKEEAHGQT